MWLKRGIRTLRRRKAAKKNLRILLLLVPTFTGMWYLTYNTNLKEFSRQLRNHSTMGEILLWKKLRAGTMMNYSFNRQKPLNQYIVDFYSKPLKPGNRSGW